VVVIIIVYLKCRIFDLDHGLNNVSNCIKDSAVFGSVMAEAVSQAMELLEETIDGLMAGSSNCFHVLIRIVKSIRSERPTIAITAGAIRKEEFISSQSFIQTISADGKVGPVAWSIGTIDPDNPTSLNTDTNLIPETRMLELLGAPLAAERSWLIDLEISSINSNQAKGSNVVLAATFPLDLVCDTMQRRRVGACSATVTILTVTILTMTMTHQIKVSKHICATPNPLPVHFPGSAKDSSQHRLIHMQL